MSLKHADITGKIIGSAMTVHNSFGNGFQDVVYQRCLAIEMEKAGLNYIRELAMPLYYDGKGVGTRRVDFFVEEKVMVEIKALTQLEDVHLAQAINYLEAYNIETGLLMNFGERSLIFKRLINKKRI